MYAATIHTYFFSTATLHFLSYLPMVGRSASVQSLGVVSGCAKMPSTALLASAHEAGIGYFTYLACALQEMHLDPLKAHTVPFVGITFFI